MYLKWERWVERNTALRNSIRKRNPPQKMSTSKQSPFLIIRAIKITQNGGISE
jgi:hypothetical protein